MSNFVDNFTIANICSHTNNRIRQKHNHHFVEVLQPHSLPRNVRIYPPIENDAQDISVEDSYKLQTRIVPGNDHIGKENPSLNKKCWIIKSCSSSSEFYIYVFVIVFKLFSAGFCLQFIIISNKKEPNQEWIKNQSCHLEYSNYQT